MRHVIFLFLVLLLLSCDDNGVVDQEINNVNVEINDDSSLISESKIDITSDDAAKVAQLFLKNSAGAKTRAIAVRNVKEMIAICDSLNNPTMYVINYGDDAGFVIVSATKKHYPIIAYSDEGNFDISASNGSMLWIGLVKKGIEEIKKDSSALVNSEWLPYEQGSEALFTRAGNYGTIGWWRDEMIHDIKYSGVYDEDSEDENVRGEKTGEKFLNYDEMVSLLGDATPEMRDAVNKIAYAGYSDPNLAIFHVKYYANGRIKEPLLKTYWHQRAPYNASCPDNSLVGCVPVAIGQIMNFHRWPNDYADWGLIEANQTQPVAQLLAKIGDDIGMVYGSEQSYPKWWQPLKLSDLSQVKKFFGEHQYDYSKKPVDGNTNSIANEIIANRPVYMEGTQELFRVLGIRIPSLNAHAWVCDGYTYYGSGQVWAVYIPVPYNQRPDDPMDENPYERITRYSDTNWGNGSWSYFHMNWGWGRHGDYNKDDGTYSVNNGWFRDADISIRDQTDYTVFYRFISAIPNK